MLITINEISRVIIGQSNYCGLCLKDIQCRNFYFIEDEVALNQDKTEILRSLIHYVLGIQVVDNLSSHSLCLHCTETIIKCYKFVLKSKYYVHNIQKIINSLAGNLEEEVDNIYNTLFVTIDTDNSTSNTYFEQDCVPKDGKAILKKLETIIPHQQPLIKIELECWPFDGDTCETEVNELCNLEERKKVDNILVKHRNLVKIPTSEMKYDKNDSSEFKCKLCLQTYPRAFNLRQHYFRIHSPKIFKCSKCSKSVGSKSLLMQHVADSHSPVICAKCGKSYCRTSFKSHFKSHTQRYVCQACGKVFKSKRYCAKHTQLKICDRSTRKEHLVQYTCDYCKKAYSSKGTLRVHIKLEHENGKYHECEWCKKKFSAISRLKAHVVKHTQERNFYCNICSGRFVTKEALVNHTRIHTGEKPYKCELCDQAFLSTSRRADHIRRHHLKLFVECEICNNKFSTNASLVRHKKRHLDPNSRLHYQPASKGDI